MAGSFVQISVDERRVIVRMREKKNTLAESAHNLRRDCVTISWEMRRDFRDDCEVLKPKVAGMSPRVAWLWIGAEGIASCRGTCICVLQIIDTAPG